MRKSTPRNRNYRKISSHHRDRLVRFREQMTDYARGEKLRYLREEKRLTQAEAAHQSGITERTIRSWEHDGKIRWTNAKRYAKFYDVDPETIVTRELKAPVEPEDIERMQEQLEELLARTDATDDAANVAKKNLPPARVRPKRQRRKGK